MLTISYYLATVQQFGEKGIQLHHLLYTLSTRCTETCALNSVSLNSMSLNTVYLP